MQSEVPALLSLLMMWPPELLLCTVAIDIDKKPHG
jgi:hypothetical protein